MAISREALYRLISKMLTLMFEPSVSTTEGTSKNIQLKIRSEATLYV